MVYGIRSIIVDMGGFDFFVVSVQRVDLLGEAALACYVTMNL